VGVRGKFDDSLAFHPKKIEGRTLVDKKGKRWTISSQIIGARGKGGSPASPNKIDKKRERTVSENKEENKHNHHATKKIRKGKKRKVKSQPNPK